MPGNLCMCMIGGGSEERSCACMHATVAAVSAGAQGQLHGRVAAAWAGGPCVLRALEHGVEVPDLAAGRHAAAGTAQALDSLLALRGVARPPRQAPRRRRAEGATRAAVRVEVLEEELALLRPPLALRVDVPAAPRCVPDAMRALAAVLAHGRERFVRDGEALLTHSGLGAGRGPTARARQVHERVAVRGPRVLGPLCRVRSRGLGWAASW
mmetsp:Transcript_51302/g.158842  ORF Transcript_51302/g.158842 Transcript_51302/m.158842 type:complete len:211 (+) Transcript_51302:63-695(+)